MRSKRSARPNTRWRIAYLVVALRAFEATDPLDKAYGILGLINCTAIQVNYHKTGAEVYTDLFERSIAESGSLDIICMKRDSAQIDPLPSWVPDWRYSWMSLPCHPLSSKWVSGKLLRDVLAPRDHLAMSADYTQSYPECWNAHGSTTATHLIARGPRPKLTALGRRVGIIESLGQISPFQMILQDQDSMTYSRIGRRSCCESSEIAGVRDIRRRD